MKPVGMELWMGPLLGDDGESLYQELAYWLRGKRAERAGVCGWEYPPAVGVAASEWSWSYAMGWLGCALAMIEAGETGDLDGLKSFDLRRLQTEKHWIRRSGGSAPQEWVSRHTGIVTRMRADLECFGQWHAQAEYRLSALSGELHRQRRSGFAYGSGECDSEARDKAVYEAVERFCSHFDGEEEFAVMAYDAETCIHPNELMLFSEEQYAGREVWNVGRPDVEQVPERFREDLPIAWMRAKAVGDTCRLPHPLALNQAVNLALRITDGDQRGRSVKRVLCRGLPNRVQHQQIVRNRLHAFKQQGDHSVLPVDAAHQRANGAASGSPTNTPWAGHATLRQYASSAVAPCRYCSSSTCGCGNFCRWLQGSLTVP